MDALTITSYEEAENYLNEIPKFTKKNEFAQTKDFYMFLQSEESGVSFQEKDLGKIIHVAGTNGKGSVCAFLSQICIESGLKTGFFLSPHLVTTRERFQINGDMISEACFLDAFHSLERAIHNYRKKCPDYQPTYFERLFFMMTIIFAKEKVEVCVLETGLGGRLDTTNVIDSPALCVITEIGLDHMAYLGDTVGKIASEKAGIIKPKIPVVYMDKKKEATVEIEKKAKEQNAPCYKVSKNAYKITEIQKKSIDFLLGSRYYDYIGFTLHSKALYQLENASVAVQAIEVLKEVTGWDCITKESMVAGVGHMYWPGRMEEILPQVYLDGAHNEDGIDAFVQTVTKMFENDIKGKGILLFSAVNDKLYEHMIAKLCQIPQLKEFIVTRIPGSRGVDMEELKNQFRKYTSNEVYSFQELSDAFGHAREQKGEEDVIFIVGSLYLAGLVKEFAGEA